MVVAQRGKLWKLPRLWKSGKRTACFPTFPQALGKLVAKNARRVFHSSHTFYYWFYCLKKEKKECDISDELKHVTFLKSFDKV